MKNFRTQSIEEVFAARDGRASNRITCRVGLVCRGLGRLKRRRGSIFSMASHRLRLTRGDGVRVLVPFWRLIFSLFPFDLVRRPIKSPQKTPTASELSPRIRTSGIYSDQIIVSRPYAEIPRTSYTKRLNVNCVMSFYGIGNWPHLAVR